MKLNPIIKFNDMYIKERIIPFISPFFFVFIPRIIEAIKNSKIDKMLVIILAVVKDIKLFCCSRARIKEKIKVENNINNSELT